MEPHYPDWKRNVFRYTISMPVIILSLFIVFYVMLLIFQLQEWVNQVVAAGDAPSFMRFGPKVLMAVVISLLDEVYKQVAIWLNNKGKYVCVYEVNCFRCFVVSRCVELLLL